MSARPSDKYIPWLFVAFFAVQAGLFMWFARIAHESYPGVVSEQPYDKGIKYNDVIADADRQAALGWALSLALEPAGGGKRVVTLSAADRDGRPLSGLSALLWVTRPVSAGLDQHLPMRETAPGRYQAAVGFPAPGLWALRAEARTGAGRAQVSKRVEVKP
jgi:nitrogen fixation protein FixH